MIFVFGSNLAGRHGKGSALHAKLNYGAIYGQGIGRQGNSYAIPTKDGRDGGSLRRPNQILPIWQIKQYVDAFIAYAKAHSELEFKVVAIGCSNSGYVPNQIAPLFIDTPPNCHLPDEFLPYVN